MNRFWCAMRPCGARIPTRLDSVQSVPWRSGLPGDESARRRGGGCGRDGRQLARRRPPLDRRLHHSSEVVLLILDNPHLVRGNAWQRRRIGRPPRRWETPMTVAWGANWMNAPDSKLRLCGALSEPTVFLLPPRCPRHLVFSFLCVPLPSVRCIVVLDFPTPHRPRLPQPRAAEAARHITRLRAALAQAITRVTQRSRAFGAI